MTNAPKKERSSFSTKEGQILLEQAEACITAALDKSTPPTLHKDLCEAPVVGVFVSLKRGNILRACCGSLNENVPAPLGELLSTASERAALNDVRFPAVSIEELDSLDIEVSVLHDLRTMPEDPNLRLNSLTIGRHGLIITHKQGRGLLLPQVAAEHSWDSVTFLQQVCKKAGLPSDTWLRPEATLKQFSASIFHRHAEVNDIDFRELPDEVAIAAHDFATRLIAGEDPKKINIPEQLKTPVAKTGWGLLIQTVGKSTEAAFRKKGTLADLILRTTKGLHNPDQKKANKIQDFLAFSHPVDLCPEDFPDRLKHLQPGVAVTARKGKRTSVVLNRGPRDPVTQVLEQMGETPSSWASSGVALQIHQVLSLTRPEKVEHIQAPVAGTTVNGIRLPAFAGKFYPASEKDLNSELDRYFRNCETSEKKKVRAVMLPHAGWKYCGDLIAETLGQIEIPDIVVIIGPKHTPLGSRWSASNAKKWRIPGAEIPVDEESVAYLAANSKILEKEELAHQKEHGIEVLIPFLHRLNAKVRIAPVVVSSGTLEDFQDFGRVLKNFRDRLSADGEDCLFIISSDMNHFAEDKVNRELDKKALDALKTGNTEKLFNTCIENNISMCGMRPAVAVISSLGLNVEMHCPDIEIVRYETSARITNDPSRVVGYAGALLF
ncbi:MAG: AmmeMemoRadiSam system protein B [Verrucomicrobiales bacterium]|nr:AmmeMemoRadiSam system protein B [Verrucomicrobiales bacterium]